MGKVIMVGCNKGGCGKSTTSVNIAISLALKEFDVCFVDADKQRSGAKWYADRVANGHQPEITLVEKLGSINSTLAKLKTKYDFIIVDVAGRNSEELISGLIETDIAIAPHQSSQFDLDTLGELENQIIRIRSLNPELQVFAYQAMANPNPVVMKRERDDFISMIEDFETLKVAKSIGYYRINYRDTIPEGKSVLESDNKKAMNEIESLVKELIL